MAILPHRANPRQAARGAWGAEPILARTLRLLDRVEGEALRNWIVWPQDFKKSLTGTPPLNDLRGFLYLRRTVAWGERSFQHVARVMGAGKRQIFLKVVPPAASPWIINGLKMSLPFALIGAIIGDFMAASKGLGFRLQLYTGLFNTTGAIAVIFILMFTMIAFNAILNRLEEHLLRWRPKATMGGEASEVH
jgi:hypothetical protein